MRTKYKITNLPILQQDFSFLTSNSCEFSTVFGLFKERVAIGCYMVKSFDISTKERLERYTHLINTKYQVNYGYKI